MPDIGCMPSRGCRPDIGCKYGLDVGPRAPWAPWAPMGPHGAPWGPLGPLGAPWAPWGPNPPSTGVSIFKKFTKSCIFCIFCRKLCFWGPRLWFWGPKWRIQARFRPGGAAFGKHLTRNPTFGTHTVSLCGNHTDPAGGRCGGRAVAPTQTPLVSPHPPKIAIPLLGGGPCPFSHEAASATASRSATLTQPTKINPTSC